MTNPLILTLQIDAEAQAYFNAMRKQYFPPERNFLDAHLTLFHNLPAGEEEITRFIKEITTVTGSFQLSVIGLMGTGNGVAFKIESPTLSTIHKQMQNAWQQWLIPQDRQTVRPHITVQNKVSAEEAKALQNKLALDFKPFSINAQGFALWEYLGGPWKFVEGFKFN